MGHFVTDEVKRLELGKGLWVDLKEHMNYGDQQKLIASFVKLSPKGEADVSLDAGNLTLLLINIKAWNLTDDKGAVVPITAEWLNKLDNTIATKIALEINHRNPAPKA